jgi:hypothetical protein
MDALIASAGRCPEQRTTLYGIPPDARTTESYRVLPLAPLQTGMRSERPARELSRSGVA